MAGDSRRVKKPPIVAPGAGVSDALKNSLYYAKSASVAVASDTLPALLFTVPANTFIYDIIVNVTTQIKDSASGATLLVGYVGDSDAFYADTTKTLAKTYSMHGGGGVKSGGMLTTGETVIEASWATTCSAGAFNAILIFAPYGDESYHDPYSI